MEGHDKTGGITIIQCGRGRGRADGEKWDRQIAATKRLLEENKKLIAQMKELKLSYEQSQLRDN